MNELAKLDGVIPPFIPQVYENTAVHRYIRLNKDDGGKYTVVDSDGEKKLDSIEFLLVHATPCALGEKGPVPLPPGKRPRAEMLVLAKYGDSWRPATCSLSASQYDFANEAQKKLQEAALKLPQETRGNVHLLWAFAPTWKIKTGKDRDTGISFQYIVMATLGMRAVQSTELDGIVSAFLSDEFRSTRESYERRVTFSS